MDFGLPVFDGEPGRRWVVGECGGHAEVGDWNGFGSESLNLVRMLNLGVGFGGARTV